MKRTKSRRNQGGARIVTVHGVCGGRPVFEGTSIEPRLIWSWLLHGYTEARILQQYPTIERSHVRLARALMRSMWELAFQGSSR